MEDGSSFFNFFIVLMAYILVYVLKQNWKLVFLYNLPKVLSIFFSKFLNGLNLRPSNPERAVIIASISSSLAVCTSPWWHDMNHGEPSPLTMIFVNDDRE